MVTPEQAKQNPVVRYYPGALIISVVYLGLLVTPWILTCILNARRRATVSVEIWGKKPDPGLYLYPEVLIHPGLFGVYIRAIRILEPLATVVSLPVVSALLARASVVYSQRNRHTKSLNARQLFALADQKWGYADCWLVFARMCFVLAGKL